MEINKHERYPRCERYRMLQGNQILDKNYS